MTSLRRGLFVIINNDQFLPETKLHRLVGAHRDVANLCKVFSKLGFEIRQHLNITADETVRVLTKGMHRHTVCLACDLLLTFYRTFYQCSSDGVMSSVGMSEFCDSARTEFCAELANMCRIGRRAQN